MNAPINVEDYRQRMRERAHPFIGHEGIGSRISIKKTSHKLILKESAFSQLIVLFGLLLFGPGLTTLMLAKRDDHEFLRTPRPILVILGLFSLIGWVFAVKYFFRLAAGRRIEVSADEVTVSLFTAGHRVQTQVSRQEIEGLDTLSTWFHGDSDWVENFTLRLKCHDGRSLELCTSDSRNNIESVKSSIKSLIP